MPDLRVWYTRDAGDGATEDLEVVSRSLVVPVVTKTTKYSSIGFKMENQFPFLFGVVIGFIVGASVVLFGFYIWWMSGPAPDPLREVTGGISTPLQTPDPTRHSSVGPDTLREVGKTYLLITGCRDSSMWYSGKVGCYVDHLGIWPESGYISRDSGGFKNVVRFGDAVVVHGRMNRGM